MLTTIETPSRPRFKHAYRVEVVPPAHVFLVTETKSFILEGKVYAKLASLLTGEHTVDELITLLEQEIPAPEVMFALQRLEQRGHLVNATAIDPARAAFWEVLDRDAADAEARLATATVAVRVVGPLAEEAGAAVRAALTTLGIQIDDQADAVVVVTDDYLEPELDTWNQEALARGVPWLLVKPVGTVMWFGPLFTPGAGACWQCLAQRVQGNRHVEHYLQRRSGESRPVATSKSATAATLLTAAGLTGVHVARWLAAGGDPALQDRIVTLDQVTMASQTHHVVRRPQCPSCGGEEWRTPRERGPIELVSQQKRYDEDGGYRTKTPEEVYATLAHHVSPISGVVSSLERLSGDSGSLAHSYAAGHNFAMMTDTLFFLRENLRGRSGGKGLTEMQAKVGGMCEAIERYSGVYRGEEFEVRSTLRTLGEQGVNPESCMLFSQAQYANRQAWNNAQPHTKFHLVPEPFDIDRQTSWAPLWSLTEQRVRYLPSAYCYFGHPDQKSHFFCLSDANGCAAGSTLEEAILQGFLELVERDAVALWWYNRVPRPAVDLDSFDVPYFHALAKYYKTIGREYWLIDITSDLGIPTFVGVSRRIDRPVEDIIIGFGSHLDPRLAILRALTEVNQFLPAVTRVNPDGSTQYWFHDTDAINWWKTATIVNRPYVAPDPRTPARAARDYAPLAVNDIKEDVVRCVEIAARHGLETLVLDQTRPDVGLNVAKVVVPGLRHFWRRLAPGRLYDVPVTQGWVSQAPTEQDMNPVSIFF